jgi:hypothetical protein
MLENWWRARPCRDMGGQGLLAESGLRSWGGEADSKHSPSVRFGLESGRLDDESDPKRKGCTKVSCCPRPDTALVVKFFIRLREGRRGAAILRSARRGIGGSSEVGQHDEVGESKDMSVSAGVERGVGDVTSIWVHSGAL